MQGEHFKKKIHHYTYKMRDVVGRGHSSVVYLGWCKKRQEPVAVKVVDVHRLQRRGQHHMVKQEIKTLRQLQHPNLIQCYDVVRTLNNIYIFTQYCQGGNLQQYLKNNGPMVQNQAMPWIKQLLCGYFCLQKQGVVHCDLKPANLLLKDNCLKIADFGFVRKSNQPSNSTLNAGSPFYMPPQALKGNHFSAKSDIWAIGVILYQLFHGQPPWTSTTQHDLYQQITNDEITLPSHLSQDLQHFILSCLTPNPSQRMCPLSMRNHPFTQKMFAQQRNVVPNYLYSFLSLTKRFDEVYKQDIPLNFLAVKQLLALNCSIAEDKNLDVSTSTSPVSETTMSGAREQVLLGLQYAIEQCKAIWKVLQEQRQWSKQLTAKIDLTMSYVQICRILLGKGWKSSDDIMQLDLILQSDHSQQRQLSQLSQIEDKLHLLSILG